MHPMDHGRVGGPAVQTPGDPVLGRAGRVACLEAFPQFAPETADLAGHAVGQRELVGAPARDGRGAAIGPGHEALHGPGPLHPQGSTRQREHVADLQAPEEPLLDGTDPRVAQDDLDHALAGNRSDVLEEIAADRARAHFEGVGLEVDLAEEVGVLPPQRLAAAGQEVEHGIEVGARQVPVRMRSPDLLIGLVAGRHPRAGQAHQVLGEHVERGFRDADAVEVAGPGEQGGGAAFDEVAHVGGHEQSAAHLTDAVAGAAHALQGAGHPFRRGQQHHQVDAPDVDAQLERGRADHRPQFAALEPVFHIEAQFAVERGVMAFDVVGQRGQLFLEPVGGRFGTAAGVGEHEGGAVRRHQLRQIADQALPAESGLGIGLPSERAVYAQVHPLGRGGFDDRDLASDASQEGGGFFAGMHRGGEPDALQSRCGVVRAFRAFWWDRGSRGSRGRGRGRERCWARCWNRCWARCRGRGDDLLQPFQRQREMGAALVLGQRVQFIDDHPAHRGQLRQPFLLAEHQAEALGRGEQQVGRVVELALAFGGRRVPGTQADPDRADVAIDFLQRGLKVLGQVVAQGPERREVEAPERFSQAALGVLSGQCIQHPQEGREGLAGARGRDDEHVPPLRDHGPSRRLDRGGFPVPASEPVVDHRGHGACEGGG